MDTILNSGNGNESSNGNDSSSQWSDISKALNSMNQYMAHMDSVMSEMLQQSKSSASQSDLKDKMQHASEFRNRKSSKGGKGSDTKKSNKGFLDQIEDAFWKEMRDGLLGSDFSDKIKESMNAFADEVGVPLKDLPKQMGQDLAKMATSSLKNSDMFKSMYDKVQNWAGDVVNQFSQGYAKGKDAYWSTRDPKDKEAADAKTKAAKEMRTKSGSSVSDGGSESVVKDAAKAAADTAANSSTSDTVKSMAADALEDVVTDKLGSKVSSFVSSKISNVAGKAISGAANTAMSGIVGSGGSTATGAVLSGLASGAGAASTALASAIPVVGAVVAGLTLLDKGIDIAVAAFKKALAPAAKELGDLFDTLNSTISRSTNSALKSAENTAERYQEDVKTLITEPFEILEDAANAVYEAWDNYISTLNATQGYTKEDLQDLLSAYAERLRSEGLSSTVSVVDIVSSLETVLESGLSGTIAEEFAYIATVLNAAIPTEDFFSYASSYASIAANAMASGMSQSEAIEYANEQLEMFASSLLYSSRTLTGGFTTGLQNASDLFKEATTIAQTAGTNDSTAIASVLTAVAAYVGAVAPDLATELTDAIYNAAVGGNSSELVALRSLAGINASNTEFLNALVEDPQSVFVELFNNLAQLQNMSEDNYMEVAEGLANIFGLSSAAIAQIDFSALADAIANMNTSTASLDENLDLLASGETTTTAEQLRIQQINEYLIDEGLSYVLDNEVARAVQQHLWDQELAEQLMEAEYAVNLTGDSLSAITGIYETVKNIIKVLVPVIGIGSALSSVIATAQESYELQSEIAAVLEYGKVGAGDSTTVAKLTNYTTAGVESTVSSYLTLMREVNALQSNSTIASLISSSARLNNNISSSNSVYSWGGIVGKSIANYLASTTASGSSVGSTIVSSGTSATTSATQAKIDKMLDEDYIMSIIESGGTYEDWAETAKKFGIADLSAALEDVGYSEEDVEARFASAEAKYGAIYEYNRQLREEEFWDNTEAYLEQLNEYAEQMVDLQTYANEVLDAIYAKNVQFYDAWVDYYVKHTAYSAAYDHSTVTKIQKAEQSGSQDAVYALAEALTQNTVDLLDPTIQTNALLSQILIVVNAIMQQNNQASSGTSLPDALQALATGLVKST